MHVQYEMIPWSSFRDVQSVDTDTGLIHYSAFSAAKAM